MSRLIDPGIGEITDRLTILTLKLLYGGLAGKEVSHFQAERTSLLAKIRSRNSLNGVWFDQTLTLAAVNAALWQAEDELRIHREMQHLPIMDRSALICGIAFRIQDLNDRRAGLVAEINKAVGDTVGGMEKV